MFKTLKEYILYFGLLFIVGLVWFFIYNRTSEYNMYPYNDGVVDTTQVYTIAPRYTKKVMSPEDTIYMFFNKKRQFVLQVRKDSLEHYIIKK